MVASANVAHLLPAELELWKNWPQFGYCQEMLVHLTASASDSSCSVLCDNWLSLNCQSFCISSLNDGEADADIDGCGLMVDPLPTGPTSCGDDIIELEVDTFHGPLIQFAIVTSI